MSDEEYEKYVKEHELIPKWANLVGRVLGPKSTDSTAMKVARIAGAVVSPPVVAVGTLYAHAYDEIMYSPFTPFVSWPGRAQFAASKAIAGPKPAILSSPDKFRLPPRPVQAGGNPPVSPSAVPVTPHPMDTAFAYPDDGTPGRVDPTPPRALLTAEVEKTVMDFAHAAQNALAADFDGVDCTQATGYLPEQFLNPRTNLRTDRYGGSMENRARFLLEVGEGIVAQIGADKLGVRLSPHSTLYDLPEYPENEATYLYLAQELGRRGVVYLHLHDIGAIFNNGIPLIPNDLLSALKTAFGGPMILAGGLTKRRATDLIGQGLIDLAAFGRPYIANPDLVERLQRNIPLATPDRNTYFGGDAHGYTDYPVAGPTSE